MGIARKMLIGVCALALAGGAAQAARKTLRLQCARPAEFSAMQVAAAQQELMVAALTCGVEARTDYNAFQTAYTKDLRQSDRVMLNMFRRLMGGRKGDAAYNLFKTDLASKAESRRIRHAPNFCAAVSRKARIILDPARPELAGYAADQAEVDFAWPVESCFIVEARLLIPDIMPRPNPHRLAEAQIAPPSAPPPAEPAPVSP